MVTPFGPGIRIPEGNGIQRTGWAEIFDVGGAAVVTGCNSGVGGFFADCRFGLGLRGRFVFEFLLCGSLPP